MKSYDCIVAGLGAAGSAALFHVSGRDARVAGFDAHTPPHQLGSSHGESRMIREAYFEDPRYVPLVRRAYHLWHKLATDADAVLIEETGGVFTGRDGDELLPGIRLAAGLHDIAIREYSATDAARAFAWLKPSADMDTLTEPRAGLLNPERCIRAHLDGASRRGATLHHNEAVTDWHAGGDGVIVETANGRYQTQRLIVATGARMVAPLAAAGVNASVARQVLYWFHPADAVAARALPVFAVEFEKGRLYYGFPDRGRGIKVAIHDPGTPTTPDTIDRAVHPREIDAIRGLAERYTPGLVGALRETATCMYTNTPDGHFLIDEDPRLPGVILVSACSGHGFKFASAVGEAAAQWALDGKPALDLSAFSLSRFR
jgi:sarcosine oxidase